MKLRKRLDNVTVGEKVVITFDFAKELAIGETLGAPTVTVSVLSGVDADPAALKNGAAVVSGTGVLQPVVALLPGVDYELVCLCPTSNVNKTLSRIGRLCVE